MLYHKLGFTLIEILIVILIISIVSGVVVPVAYRLTDKFNARIEKYEDNNMKRMAKFLSFITEEKCKLEKGKVICGKHYFRNIEDVLK